MASGMDAEYNAMRRRMSRLRVKGVAGKGASLEAEDADASDPAFKDLIKYWKKHGIPIPKDLITDMADENVRQAKARGKGRRRSKELEDLHMCASTGKFNLEHMTLKEEPEEDTVPELKNSDKTATKSKVLKRSQTDNALGKKVPSRPGSFKRADSKVVQNGTSSPRPGSFKRADSKVVQNGTSNPRPGSFKRADSKVIQNGTSSPASGRKSTCKSKA